MTKIKKILQSITFVALLFGLANGFCYAKIKYFDQKVSAKNNQQNVITIFDGAKKQTILVKDSTVKQVLKKAKIKINPSDVIKPNLNYKINNDIYINIYRANPITIIADGQKVNLLTPYKQTAEILKQAQINYHKEDNSKVEINNLNPSQGIGVELVVKRAKTIKLNLYGKENIFRTQTKTIDEFLKEKKIKISKNDRLNHQLTDRIIDGLYLDVWFEGEKQETIEEIIPFSKRIVKNYDKPTGYHQITTAGKNGKKVVTYKLKLKNKQLVNKTEIKSVIVEQPIEQVEEVGMKINLPPGSHQDWMRAAGIAEADFGIVNYLVSRESGWRVNATNRSSGAYGLPQALPGSKMATAGADWRTNPITQLRWMQSYVNGRYGGWNGAYSFWRSHHWY